MHACRNHTSLQTPPWLDRRAPPRARSGRGLARQAGPLRQLPAPRGQRNRPRPRYRAPPPPSPYADPHAPRTARQCLIDDPHRTVPHVERYHRQEWGLGAGRVGNDKIRVLDPDRESWTVLGSMNRGSRQRRNHCVETIDGRVRLLDWREAARLQGFPADYLFPAGLQRTEKMIGQAISIDVGRAILRAICHQAACPTLPATV